MRKFLPSLLLLAALASGQDSLSLKAFNQKHLDNEIEKAISLGELNKDVEPLRKILNLDSSTNDCAIRLKEMPVSSKIDPISPKSLLPAKPIDPIAHPARIQACPQH